MSDLLLTGIYVVVFLTVFLACEGVGVLLVRRRRRAEAINRRLALTEASESNGAREEALLREVQVGWRLNGLDVSGINPRQLHRQSGLSMSLPRLALFCLLGAAAASFASTKIAVVPWLQVAGVPVLAFLALVVVLRRARAARCERFAEQLPDAVDVTVRSLRAGHPFAAALELVASEMPDPAGTEFGLLAHQLSYGTPVEEAIRAIHARIPVDDLRYLGIALAIHEKSGGNLAETLQALSDIIRQRFAAKGKVRALSAEGRFTAKLLSVFPLILYGVLSAIAPSYFDDLWASGWGTHLIVFSVVLTLIGNVVVGRMVKLEV